MSHIFFYVSLFSILLIYLLFLASYLTRRYRFFPPPSDESWQYTVFWSLFRVFILSLGVTSYFFYDKPSSLAITVLALILLIAGFGIAAYLSYGTLGRQNSYGLRAGFVTDGLFRYSRNPIYVASIVGMLGWGLLVNSAYVWVLLLFWGLIYLCAPMVEEPWLEEQYGLDYIQYKNKVPRFIGIRKKNQT